MGDKENPHEGHRMKMWATYSQNGIKAFAEHELLEMLLFLVIPRVNTNVTAHNLLSRFGSIKNVLDAHINDLKKIKGIGKNAALYLNFIGEIFEHVFITKAVSKTSLNTSKKVTQFCVDYFKDQSNEVFSLLMLDNKFSLLHVCDFSNKDPNQILINYRAIIQKVIKYDCVKVIIAHNHPFGSASPSDDDIKTTNELANILNIINVGLVDHIIVSNNTAFSMRGSGLLNSIWDFS